MRYNQFCVGRYVVWSVCPSICNIFESHLSGFSIIAPAQLFLTGLPYVWRCIFSRVHATLQPALSVCQSVGRSVCPSVTLSFFRRLRAVWWLLLPPNHLVCQFHHCPCPPARDFGCCKRPCYVCFLSNVCFIIDHLFGQMLFSSCGHATL